MSTPRSTFLWGAGLLAVMTIALFHLGLRMLAYVHGMPHPRLSSTDVMQVAVMTEVFAAFMVPFTAAIHRGKHRPLLRAALAAAGINLMNTCFAVSQVMPAYGEAFVALGFLIGAIGGFMALRLGVETEVGAWPMLATVLIGMVVFTGAIQ